MLWAIFLYQVACWILSSQKQVLRAIANRLMYLALGIWPGRYMKVSFLLPQASPKLLTLSLHHAGPIQSLCGLRNYIQSYKSVSSPKHHRPRRWQFDCCLFGPLILAMPDAMP